MTKQKKGYQFIGSIEIRPETGRGYTVDVGNITATPTGPTTTLIDLSDGSDVSGSLLGGSPSVNGVSITTSRLLGTLTSGKTYRMITEYVIDGASQTDLFWFDLVVKNES